MNANGADPLVPRIQANQPRVEARCACISQEGKQCSYCQRCASGYVQHGLTSLNLSVHDVRDAGCPTHSIGWNEWDITRLTLRNHRPPSHSRIVSRYDSRSQALLSRRVDSLHHLQLLSADATSGNGAAPRSISPRPGTRPPALRLRASGIRCHAGTRSSADDHAHGW